MALLGAFVGRVQVAMALLRVPRDYGSLIPAINHSLTEAASVISRLRRGRHLGNQPGSLLDFAQTGSE